MPSDVHASNCFHPHKSIRVEQAPGEFATSKSFSAVEWETPQLQPTNLSWLFKVWLLASAHAPPETKKSMWQPLLFPQEDHWWITQSLCQDAVEFVSIWQLRFQVVPLSLFFMKQNKKWHVLWNVGSMPMFDVSWHQLGINDFFHNGMVSVALLVLLLGMDIGHSAGGLEQSCLLEVRKVGQPRRFTLAAHTVAQSFLSKSRAEWLAIATCLRFGLELLSRYNCHVPRSSCSWTSVGS